MQSTPGELRTCFVSASTRTHGPFRYALALSATLAVSLIAVGVLYVVVSIYHQAVEREAAETIRAIGGSVVVESAIPSCFQRIPGADCFQRVSGVILEDSNGFRQNPAALAEGGDSRFHQGFAEISRFRMITRLDVSNSIVNDDDITVAAVLSRLSDIDLSYTQVTDIGMAHLRNCPLERVSLASTHVTDSGVLALPMERIRELDLFNCRLVDSGIRAITESNSIERLSLGHPDISDVVVDHLCRNGSIRDLSLKNSAVTLQGVCRLHDRRPEIDIKYWGTLIVEERDGCAGFVVGGVPIDTSLPPPPHSVAMEVQFVGSGEGGSSHWEDELGIEYVYRHGVGRVWYAGATITVADYGRRIAIEDSTLGGGH